MRMSLPAPRRALRRLAKPAGSARRVSTRTLALASAVLLAVGLFSAASQAETTSTQTTFLAKVGPTSPVTGFPAYYQDSNGLRLAHCLDATALCGPAVTDVPNPSQPISFPNNFPFESFYFLSQSVITLPTGAKALFVGGLEAGFNSGDVQDGSQMTFARVRLRIDVPTTGHYVITHPYGVDEFDVATPGDRAINYTADVGIASGVFTGALGGRLNPFLTWDTGLMTAPDGSKYIGDPGVDHAVTGSPFNTNFFRIDGPDIGGPGINSITTNLFSLTGKVATNAGLDPGHPTYSRTDTSGGMVDVVAATDPNKSVRAKLAGDPSATTLRGDANGHYVARLPFTGATPPTGINVTNFSDNPRASFDLPVTDLVMVTEATYDADQRTLTVSAASTDQAVPPTLTAKGYGAMTAGTQTLSPAISSGTVPSTTPPTLSGTVAVGSKTFVDVDAPPEQVTVTSAAGGSASRVVEVTGAAFPSDPVSADAGPDQTVQQGQTVLLDGTGSLNATSMAWTQISGPTVTLSGANTAQATFTAPSAAVQLGFRLTAQGPGGPSIDDILVTVQAVTAPVANAGPDQNVLASSTVVLDATGSTGAASFQWTQISGPTVTLNGAATARPTFLMPAGTTPLAFQVTVTGPGGSASDAVVIRAIPDVISVARAEFRTGNAEWRIDGTSSIIDNNAVTVYVGSGTSGQVIGTALVDTTGAWSVRVRNSPVSPVGGVVTIQTTRGGQQTVPFSVRS